MYAQSIHTFEVVNIDTFGTSIKYFRYTHRRTKVIRKYGSTIVRSYVPSKVINNYKLLPPQYSYYILTYEGIYVYHMFEGKLTTY